MYASDTSRNPLQSWSSIFYWKPLFGQTFTHSITLLCHIWLKTVSKGAWETRRRREGGGGGVEKLPLFTKVTREMNQWHWQANNRYIYSENRWKSLHILVKKKKLSRPWAFDNDPDFVSLLTSSDVRIRKYSSMFGFSWTNPLVNSQRNNI